MERMNGKLPHIRVQAIPHETQRYETCGDWYYEKGNADLVRPDQMQIFGGLVVNVSQSGDWRTDAAIAVHELVEALICRHTGVTGEAVDTFDKEFERARDFVDYDTGEPPGFRFRGKWYDANFDPGDSTEAPYAREHSIATIIERIVIEAFGMNWTEHNERLDALSQSTPAAGGMNRAQ